MCERKGLSLHMSTNSIGIITVIASSLLEPLAGLVAELESFPVVLANEVQVNSRENGYSCAVVSLSVVLFESALNRTKYRRGDGDPQWQE